MGMIVPASTEIGELPLVEDVSGLGLDAWEVCRRLASLDHVLLLDSALEDAAPSRYSFVAADPFTWITSRGAKVWEKGRGLLRGADPFRILAERLADYPAVAHPALPPFQGGAAGLFGYDLCHHLERLPRAGCDDFAVPDLAV